MFIALLVALIAAVLGFGVEWRSEARVNQRMAAADRQADELWSDVTDARGPNRPVASSTRNIHLLTANIHLLRILNNDWCITP